MSKLVITTNNVPREILYWHDLTPEEQLEHDWGAEDHSFVRYKGRVIPIENFRRLSDEGELDGWHGGAADGWYFGTLIKFVDDGDVVLGSYCQTGA